MQSKKRVKLGFRVDLYQVRTDGRVEVDTSPFYWRPELDRTIRRYVKHAWWFCKKHGADAFDEYLSETDVIIDEKEKRIATIVRWRYAELGESSQLIAIVLNALTGAIEERRVEDEPAA